MSNKIEELYKVIDAKDKIINEQVLEIERLKEKIDKAIEYNKENKKFANEVENRYAEEICKNNLEILGDKDFK